MGVAGTDSGTFEPSPHLRRNSVKVWVGNSVERIEMSKRLFNVPTA